jgi:hypothetical protein
MPDYYKINELHIYLDDKTRITIELYREGCYFNNQQYDSDNSSEEIIYPKGKPDKIFYTRDGKWSSVFIKDKYSEIIFKDRQFFVFYEDGDLKFKWNEDSDEESITVTKIIKHQRIQGDY